MKVVEIAKIAHEANRAYCQTLGDNSQLPWDEAPKWQKQSAINGVEFLYSHPNATAADTHESWLREKTEAGWVYGEVKDEQAKTHPCCLPYEKLPQEQRTKDRLYMAIVANLIASGY